MAKKEGQYCLAQRLFMTTMPWIRKNLPYVFFLLVAVGLNVIYFHDLTVGEFIFSGDQLLRFSYNEAFDHSLFIRKMDHLGVFNSWQQIVQFWDILYYLATHALHLPLIIIEKLSFSFILFISFVLSFAGFRRLSSLFKQEKKDLILIAITLWYCLNPYTLVLWHGGVYILGVALTYALAPLILYYFHLSVFSDPRLKNKLICVLLLFFASFVFWLFAVIVFLLAWYSLFVILIGRKSFFPFLKNIGHLLLIYLPFISVVLFAVFHEYSSNAGDQNVDYSPTFGNQIGGLWYQFLMLFSWGIYTVWTPRTLYPFGAYFLSWQYMAVTLGLYALIPLGAYLAWKGKRGEKKKNLKQRIIFLTRSENSFFLIFLLLLGVAIFFAKGAQEPFGGIFLYLFEHVPFFSVFRSADHRFGFAVVLSVAVLLLYASQRFNKYFFFGALMTLMLFQSYPLFTGTAVRGENIEGKYYDRIIHVPLEHQEIADTLNQRNEGSGYVLVLPSVEYGHYVLDPDTVEEYVGPDLFPKLIDKPFVYASVSTGMSKAAQTTLEEVIKEKDYKKLRQFPIRYLILRRDLPCLDCLTLPPGDADREFIKLWESERFSVYEVPDAAPLVRASNAYFRMINPTQFQVQLDHVSRPEALRLGLSFHPAWKVYIEKKGSSIVCDPRDIRKSVSGKECLRKKQFFLGDEMRYLFAKSLFDSSHAIDNGYANVWTIDPDFVRRHYDSEFYTTNSDGSLNLNLRIYYQPQSWFYFSVLLSAASLLGGGGALVVNSLKKRKEERAKSAGGNGKAFDTDLV